MFKQTKRRRCSGFMVSVYSENMIEDGVIDQCKSDEDYRREALALGYVDGYCSITREGWNTLSEDVRIFERNALRWLRKTFLSAEDQGHDDGDLVGNVYWNPRSTRQRELMALGEVEGIDANDRAYGDFPDTAFEGCSPFSLGVLGGQITFFDTGL